MRIPLKLCLCALTPLFFPVSIHAQGDERDVLVLTMSQALTREDNLYRLADGVQPQLGDREDLVSRTRVGAQLRKRIGLQHLSAGIGLSMHRYRESDHLDFEGVDLDGRWDWAYGRLWEGRLSLLQRQALSGFDDFQGQQRSINTYRQGRFLADRRVAPEWVVGAGATVVASDYSGDTRPTAEYDAYGASLRAGYRGRAGNQLTLSLRRSQGDYPNRSASRLSDSSYQQDDLQLDGRWLLGGATTLSGYVGYTGRRYDFADNRDFNGATGRLELDWAPTAKLAINAMLRRELGAQEDLVDNFVVTDSLLVRPRWAATDKIDVSTSFELRRRDFGGDPGLVSDAQDRSETLRRLGLSASLRIRRTITLGASLGWEERDGDTPDRDFEARRMSLSARLAF